MDIDGTRTIDDMMSDPFIQRYLTIFYTTVSHTADRHRFRLIFALPRSIESPRDMRAASRSLALRLKGDKSATDAARIFFGSRDSDPSVYGRQLTDEILDELIAHGLDSDQNDGSAAKHVTTISQQSIAPDRMIKLATGECRQFSHLSANTTVHCPFHYDINASAFVVESKGGALGIHCSTCAQTFWPPNTSPKDDFADFDKRVREAENYFSDNQDMGHFQKFLNEDGKVHHPGLTRSRISRQQNQFIQLPESLPKGLIFIKSPKGTGKTEALSRFLTTETPSLTLDGILKSLDSAGSHEISKLAAHSTLLIGHRVSLIRQSCERLGLECYLDYEKGPIAGKRLGICVDSLSRLTWVELISSHKFEHKENIFKTIIIDESEQVLSHFLSDTIESATRDQLFKIFSMLLREAKTIIALDADLGWLTFETLSKLAQPEGIIHGRKQSTLIINEFPSDTKLEIFSSKDHLIGDLQQSVADGLRVFITSNSLKLVTALHNGFLEDDTARVKSLLITSETTSTDEVKQFIQDPSKVALGYDVILTSPSLGTGVDITFADRETQIDVVYGFFEAGITTHFDFDQQLWRVRHPGAVKVWISPQRFSFDTAIDVVKRDIQQNQLYKSVLSHYDASRKPVYHTDDPLIDMAALARCQQLASKKNLKRNFILMKRLHGHQIEFVESDKSLAVEGLGLKTKGALAAFEKYVSALLSAETLPREEFDEIEDRVKSNSETTLAERTSFARTRMERFYRRPINEDMIRYDDKSRFRSKIIRFEELRSYSDKNDRHSFTGTGHAPAEYTLSARFLKDRVTASSVTFELLNAADIYSHGKFETELVFDLLTLKPFMARAQALKPVIENLLELEVRQSEKQSVKQLGDVLKLLGLQHVKVSKTKAKSVAAGQSIYRYKLSADSLAFVESVVQRRSEVRAWDFINEHYGWSDDYSE